MALLLLKPFLAPLLVVVSTLAGRRWGPGAAGVLVGLPIVAGPILFISYLQNGAGFAVDAARSTLFGLVSLAVFAVAFARTGRRLTWAPTLAATWAAVLVMDAALSLVRVTTLVALGCTLTAAVVAIRLIPAAGPATTMEAPRAPRWDLPGRAVATGALVLTVTTASSALGPHWTGLLAPFPIATSVVAAFVLAQQGPAATARTLEGVVLGLFGFAVFCVTITALVRPLGAAAYVIGAAAAVAVQVAVSAIRTLTRPGRLKFH